MTEKTKRKINARRKIVSVALSLALAVGASGCALTPTNNSNQSAVSYDKAWANAYTTASDIVDSYNGRVVEAYEYNGNAENTGLLISNNDGSAYVKDYYADIGVTFKDNAKFDYLLPYDVEFESAVWSVWGITAFCITTLSGDEIGYVGRMHHGGNGYLAGPKSGTGYVYDAASDKYMIPNGRFTKLVDITELLTLELEDGTKQTPFFDAQNTVTFTGILPNTRDDTKGSLYFNVEGDVLTVRATVYGEKEPQIIGEMSAKEIKDGFKIKVRRIVPYRNAATGRGVYTGYAHSVLLLSLNDISLNKSEI